MSALVRETELTVIDFETTGAVEGYESQPWQIGMIRFREGKVVWDETVDEFFEVGDRPFNPRAPGRHHELRDVLKSSPTLASRWEAYQSWWYGRPLVAHNISTEKTIVQKAAPLHSSGPWIDTLSLARSAFPSLESHKLEDVCAALALDTELKIRYPDKRAHDALYDAAASALFLEYLLAQPGWADMTLEQLVAIKPDAYYKIKEQRRPYGSQKYKNP